MCSMSFNADHSSLSPFKKKTTNKSVSTKRFADRHPTSNRT